LPEHGQVPINPPVKPRTAVGRPLGRRGTGQSLATWEDEPLIVAAEATSDAFVASVE